MENNAPGVGGSLLDKVLRSQQTETLEHFSPVDTVNELLKQLSPKEADVLRRRFGLHQGSPETLEVIGASYQVTRERIRQIQRWAVNRLRKLSQTRQLLHSLDTVLQELIEVHGGIMVEDELLQALHAHVPAGPSVERATLFLLQELMSDKLSRVDDANHKPYWKLRYGSPTVMDTAIAAAAGILTSAGKPLSQADLLGRLAAAQPNYESAKPTTEALLAYISAARAIERNPFGDYGLRQWGSIIPKRMNDKIMLVMRKHGQPMHFQEITKRINEIGFDHRQAYPPTVHNELILSRDYVLIGRGIYALREWGYKPGVVADVIRDILATAAQPLSRDAIVTKVLEQRVVKKNTIHLALTNKKLFQRQADGKYRLAETISSGQP